ncbi:transposable element Tcb1 transposase [Trichonephila clavipes]|nr:transposable element Tcb1 transposase [Trichonephila clavipes]
MQTADLSLLYAEGNDGADRMPPRCTTVLDDRQIVGMEVMERAATSQTIAQQIQSVTRHSVSASTIRLRLQQRGMSTRRPLLRLPLPGNHRCLRLQWCHERQKWNDVFNDGSRLCLQHHDSRIRVWRHRGERLLNSCVMHRHTLILHLVRAGLRFLCRTLLEHISGTLNSQCYISEVLEPVVLPYT